MLLIENQSFGAERLIVDGKKFVDCTFNGTTLVFQGGDMPLIKGGTAHDIRLDFEGAAYETIKWLRQLILMGGDALVQAQFKVADRAKN